MLNHRLGADAEEEVEATPLDPNNRFQPIDAYQKIKAWTHFTFPGRQGKYSTMEWHGWHLDAIDYQKGNFDYLMGCDLDLDFPMEQLIAIEAKMATIMISLLSLIVPFSIDSSKIAATIVMAFNMIISTIQIQSAGRE